MEREIVIENSSGLHARPAALFVQEASKYKCNIKIKKGDREGSAKSILNILSLGISRGTKVSVITNGEDEGEALERLVKLIESRFGED